MSQDNQPAEVVCMLPIDDKIGKHYGDQVEFEHGHTLSGQPGKVRLLAWRNRAVTASFKDALDYLKANPEFMSNSANPGAGGGAPGPSGEKDPEKMTMAEYVEWRKAGGGK